MLGVSATSPVPAKNVMSSTSCAEADSFKQLCFSSWTTTLGGIVALRI